MMAMPTQFLSIEGVFVVTRKFWGFSLIEVKIKAYLWLPENVGKSMQKSFFTDRDTCFLLMPSNTLLLF